MTSVPIDGLGQVRPIGSPERPSPGPRAAHTVDEMSPYQQFEAFALRSFVESMLPSEASQFYGAGTAGTIWRSMMAEQLGNELAQAGGIGIAATVAEDRGAGSKAADAVSTASETSARLRFDAVLAQTTKP